MADINASRIFGEIADPQGMVGTMFLAQLAHK